jgi:hypothetical protein
MDASSTLEPSSVWWKKNWAQNVFLILLGMFGVYGLVYWDLVSRAKESYLEGEKYLNWSAHPEQKKEFYDHMYAAEKIKLDELFAKKKITIEEYRQKSDALTFDKEFSLNESSLKYAYQWFKDTYELFSPPESKWVRMARIKAPEALSLWKEELRSQNIPFEDYMFE